jgi:hypothetical protein
VVTSEVRWLVRIAIAGLVLAGCWSSPSITPVPPSAEVPPTVELAVAGRRDVRFVEASARGIVVKRTVRVPSTIAALAWVGADPIVMLLANDYDESDEDDPKHDGVIARITSTGFEPYPALPASTWAALPTRAGEDGFYEVSRWRVVVTATAEVWQGHCTWAHDHDHQPCDAWLWARIDKPGPATSAEPTAAKAIALPKLTPPASPTLGFVSYSPPDADAAQEPLLRLRCSSRDHQLDYPPEDDLEFGMIENRGITWISSTPPIYQAAHGRGGFAGIVDEVIFEGCAVSKHWKEASLVGGPSDMLAMYTSEQLSVRWRGRELGKLPGASLVRFEPSTK